MKPLIILNLIDITNLDIQPALVANEINSIAINLKNTYDFFDITCTTDNEEPYVVIKCSFERHVDDRDRNFIRPF